MTKYVGPTIPSTQTIFSVRRHVLRAVLRRTVGKWAQTTWQEIDDGQPHDDTVHAAAGVDGPQNSGASTTKNEGVYCQDVSKPPISNTLDIFGLSAKGKSRTSTLGDISDSASG